MFYHDGGDHIISLPFLQKVVTTLHVDTHLKQNILHGKVQGQSEAQIINQSLKYKVDNIASR